jgi:hypothetical protein
MKNSFSYKRLNGITEDSMKNSVFGTFGVHYEKHMESWKHNKEYDSGKFLGYFSEVGGDPILDKK